MVEGNFVYQELRVASGCIFNFRFWTDPVPETYCCYKFHYFEHETMNEIHDLNACKFFDWLSVILAHDSFRKAQRDMLPLLRFKESVLRNIEYVKGKEKAVPLQAWSGPECSRKLRFPDFMTTAQDVGKVVSLTHRRPLPPGNTPVLISVRG